jgi:hypothetical protein
MVYVWTHCDFESIFNIHNRKLGTSLVGYELEKVRIDMESVYRSRLLRIRFSRSPNYGRNSYILIPDPYH